MAKFDLNKYKENMKSTEVPLKDDKFIPIGEALQAVTGLQGFPMGHCIMLYGPSNGGKSSIAYHIAAAAQKEKILPIFITTEGKISYDRIKLMGVDPENAIFTDAEYVEDIFKRLDEFTADQVSGKLPTDILFIVDSIGNTLSKDSVKVNKEGGTDIGGAMMKVSKVLRENMRIYSHRINDSRKVNSPHFMGAIFINHSYTQPPAFPGAMATDVPYGGQGIYYAASLVIKIKKMKMLKATKDGIDVTFGLVSKVGIEKNHINGVSNAGDFVIVSDGIIPNEPGAIADYKEKNRANWGKFRTEDDEVLE